MYTSALPQWLRRQLKPRQACKVQSSERSRPAPLFVLEPFEQRILMSNTLVTGSPNATLGTPYVLNLNTLPQSSENWSINWGDGSAAQPVAGAATTATHTYTTGSVARTISATVTGMTNPIDSSLGGTGTGLVKTDLGSTSDYIYRALLQPDGKILVGGGAGFSLARYNADGTLDTSFGSGGKVTQTTIGTGFGMALQPDGKIIIGGGSNFALARLNTDGSLDTTFGNGTGLTTSGFGTTYLGYDLTLLSSGKS